MKRVLPLVVLLGVGALLWAATACSQIHTDANAAYTIPESPRPQYLLNRTDRTFGSRIMRISNRLGATAMAGAWGDTARHHYSKDQPWNADGTRLLIYNNTAFPKYILLDGNTYAVADSGNPSWYDPRWHPTDPNLMIDANATKLSIYDIRTRDTTQTWTLPISVIALGNGEGNVSQSGRYVALYNADSMFVVDMTKAGAAGIGPRYGFSPDTLNTDDIDDAVVDHISISPSGAYVVVNYCCYGDNHSGQGKFSDATRVFEVNPATLALKPHNMATASLRCDGTNRPNGWILPLSHADMLYGTDGTTEYIVGKSHCPDATESGLFTVRLSTGETTRLTTYGAQDCPLHISGRATGRPGWVYVSFENNLPGTKAFSDEIVAFNINTGALERICHTHTDLTSCYLCESHPVPSRDGMRVLFASSWNTNCPCGCSSADEYKDFIVTGW